MYYETAVTPHHAGFGMWQRDEANGEGWVDERDLIQEIADNVDELFELGTDVLPTGIEDIRGKVYDEPQRLFACRTAGIEGVEYIGIIHREDN